MGMADNYENCARQGGNSFEVTGAENFNRNTQLLACTVACKHGQADVHVHFARNGNGIETGANIRNMSGVIGTWDFSSGSHLANACIKYARENAYILGFPH